jgi:peptidoglycan/LPS O-acetylase OafA/YrhL
MQTAAKGITGSRQRFVFVDGLRGIAALGIVVFHIWWYEPDPYPALETANGIMSVEFLDALFIRIRGGVQILLVISGFVIAYTLRKTWVTPAELAQFIKRRLMRLVPAYWVAIGVVILVDFACRKLSDLTSPFEGELSVTRISSHLTFLQDIVGHDPLGAGMWTICIEMQFYFVAVLGWGLAQRMFPRPVAGEPRPSSTGLLVVFAPVAFISLFHWRLLDSNDHWVTHFLWMFFLGMVTSWTLDGTISRTIFAFVVFVALVELVFDAEWRYENSLALATALAIFTAGIRDSLFVWLNWPWLQYLGKISYSLYLIHFPVCHLVTMTGWKWYSNAPTPFQASTILLTSFVASLIAGHILYTLVEAPSAKWAATAKS